MHVQAQPPKTAAGREGAGAEGGKEGVSSNPDRPHKAHNALTPGQIWGHAPDPRRLREAQQVLVTPLVDWEAADKPEAANGW